MNRILISETIEGKYNFALINDVVGIEFSFEGKDDKSDLYKVTILTSTKEKYEHYTDKITSDYVREFKKLLINATENTLLEVRL